MSVWNGLKSGRMVRRLLLESGLMAKDSDMMMTWKMEKKKKGIALRDISPGRNIHLINLVKDYKWSGKRGIRHHLKTTAALFI